MSEKYLSSFLKESFLQSKVMAAKQGLYNGFLAAGLTIRMTGVCR